MFSVDDSSRFPLVDVPDDDLRIWTCVARDHHGAVIAREETANGVAMAAQEHLRPGELILTTFVVFRIHHQRVRGDVRQALRTVTAGKVHHRAGNRAGEAVRPLQGLGGDVGRGGERRNQRLELPKQASEEKKQIARGVGSYQRVRHCARWVDTYPATSPRHRCR